MVPRLLRPPLGSLLLLLVLGAVLALAGDGKAPPRPDAFLRSVASQSLQAELEQLRRAAARAGDEREAVALQSRIQQTKLDLEIHRLLGQADLARQSGRGTEASQLEENAAALRSLRADLDGTAAAGGGR